MSRERATRRVPARSNPGTPEERAGRWLLVAVVGLFGLIVMPVVVRGGLLADEFVICMRPMHEGYGPYLHAIWQDTGVVRPARFIELFLISNTCRSLPYGFVILVPLALKSAAGILLYRLLRDLRLRTPWPAIGTAVWFLEPVGTEAALWPAALHVLLGLTLALAALRLFHRGSSVWGGLATFAAALSSEHVIFALPFAVWLLTPIEHRRRATVVATITIMIVLVAYSTWPGTNPRQAISLAARVHNTYAQPEWYVFFPAMGLGLYSGALAIRWAFPFSLVLVGLGAAAGAALFPVLLGHPSDAPIDRRGLWQGVWTVAILIALVNLPLVVTEVGYSARTFTPTWLVLSGAVAVGGARLAWARTRLVGIAAGSFAAIAFLSLALSVSVRLHTDEFNQAAAHWIADRTQDGDVVAVCDVGRTVVDPAPLGAFHLHALQAASGEWIEYYTGRVVEIRRSGERYWGARCPDLTGADLVVDFPELVNELRDRPG